MDKHLKDDDYVLEEGAAWLEVKGFAVRIHTTDEGVVVDIFNSKLLNEGLMDDALMASTYAFDNDLEVEDGN